MQIDPGETDRIAVGAGVHQRSRCARNIRRAFWYISHGARRLPPRLSHRPPAPAISKRPDVGENVPAWVVDRYFLAMFCFMLGWIVNESWHRRHRKENGDDER